MMEKVKGHQKDQSCLFIRHKPLDNKTVHVPHTTTIYNNNSSSSNSNNNTKHKYVPSAEALSPKQQRLHFSGELRDDRWTEPENS